MTGAMYAAVAGLRAHMSALNVIGNNISNVNTLGYKATRYTFNEALYTTSRNGSDGTDIVGGRNPAQIGYGCSIGTIDLDMGSKNPTPTAQPLDTMIDGDGFFLVGDDKTKTGINTMPQLKGLNLTRLGNFDVKDGWLVDGEGSLVYGFLHVNTAEGGTDGLIQIDDETWVSPVLTPIRVPYATQDIPDPGAVDDEGQNAARVVTEIYWPNVTGEAGSQSVTDNIPEVDDGQTPERVSTNTFQINELGQISITTSDGELHVIGVLAIGKVDSPNGVTHVDGRYYQAQGGAGDIHLSTIGGSVSYVPGEDEEGIVVESAGNTGLVNSCLESSGTDLANEITNMITIQRGYQANTRIVSVTDSMLEELVNMKR